MGAAQNEGVFCCGDGALGALGVNNEPPLERRGVVLDDAFEGADTRSVMSTL